MWICEFKYRFCQLRLLSLHTITELEETCTYRFCLDLCVKQQSRIIFRYLGGNLCQRKLFWCKSLNLRSSSNTAFVTFTLTPLNEACVYHFSREHYVKQQGKLIVRFLGENLNKRKKSLVRKLSSAAELEYEFNCAHFHTNAIRRDMLLFLLPPAVC